MKIVFLSILFAVVACSAKSQTIMSDQQIKTLESKVKSLAKSTHSIQADFIQKKHIDFLTNDVVSRGVMYYKSTQKLKWKYTHPFLYEVIFNKNILFINDNGNKDKIDLSQNKMFKSLNELLLKSINGDFFDAERFTFKYYNTASRFKVIFTPIDKKMKNVISTFEVFFDKQSYRVMEIKMNENQTDYSLISFVNQKFNTTISDAQFTQK